MIGCGSPAGEQGFNIARVAAVLAGLDDVPGTTVNRYCSSSLQTIRMAAHAIKAGEGDAFIAGGVECVSRYRQRRAPMAATPRTRSSPMRRTRSAERALGGSPPWSPPQGLPDIYIAMGQTAENVRELEGVSPRRRWTSSRCCRSSVPAPSMENGFFEREIVPVTTPDGTVVSKDDGPRPDTTLEKLCAAQAGVPSRRRGHGGQQLPAERRRRGGRRDERHPRPRARHHAARPHRVDRGHRRSTPRSWASARSRRAARRWPGPA